MPLDLSGTHCLEPKCFLTRSKEQRSLYCFPHSMLFFAKHNLPIVDKAHATMALIHGGMHFARGFVIGNISREGIHYYIPTWHYARQN